MPNSELKSFRSCLIGDSKSYCRCIAHRPSERRPARASRACRQGAKVISIIPIWSPISATKSACLLYHLSSCLIRLLRLQGGPVQYCCSVIAGAYESKHTRQRQTKRHHKNKMFWDVFADSTYLDRDRKMYVIAIPR